jgi:protein-S-isoprenylcysteine O-methyltransferase Ste14
MFCHGMAEGDAQPDMELVRPNRDKAASKATKAIVILLLLVSAGLILIVTIGGWSKLAGMQPVTLAYILVYLIMAFYVARWNRGVLPMAAALAILLGIFAAIAGPEWFDRDKTGFSDPALPAGVIGLLTLLIVPVQVLLIAFAMRGFQQGWNVEVEVPAGETYHPERHQPRTA